MLLFRVLYPGNLCGQMRTLIPPPQVTMTTAAAILTAAALTAVILTARVATLTAKATLIAVIVATLTAAVLTARVPRVTVAENCQRFLGTCIHIIWICF